MFVHVSKYVCMSVCLYVCMFVNLLGLTRDVNAQTVPLCSVPSTHHAATTDASTQLSISEFLHLCFTKHPSGARFHFSYTKTFVMHRPPASLATWGKSRLLMPPRSSPLQSSSNGASSLKPSRRALLPSPQPKHMVTSHSISSSSGGDVLMPVPRMQLNGSPPPPPRLEDQSRLGSPQGIHTKAAPVRPHSQLALALTSSGTSFPPTSTPTLQPQVSTTQVGTHIVRSPGALSAIGADPRAGRGPFPEPRSPAHPHASSISSLFCNGIQVQLARIPLRS